MYILKSRMEGYTWMVQCNVWQYIESVSCGSVGQLYEFQESPKLITIT